MTSVAQPSSPPGPPHRQTERAPRATRLAMFVNHLCNLRCDYCYLADEPMPDRTLPLERGRQILDDWLARTTGPLSLSFFGQEPLLTFPLVQALALHARREADTRGRALSFAMSTNATLATPEIARWLAANDVHVTVGFDGTRDALAPHRRTAAGGSSIEAALAGLEAMLAADVPVHVRVTYSPETVERLPDVVADLVARGVTRIGLAAALNMPGWTPEKSDAAGVAYAELTRRWLAWREGPRPVWLNEAASVAIRLHAGRDDGAPSACGAGKSLWATDASGRYYPCYRQVGDARNAAHGPDWQTELEISSRLSESFSVDGCLMCRIRTWCQPCPVVLEQAGQELHCRHRRSTLGAVLRVLQGEEGKSMDEKRVVVGEKVYSVPESVLEQYRVEVEDKKETEAPKKGYWYEMGESDCY